MFKKMREEYRRQQEEAGELRIKFADLAVHEHVVKNSFMTKSLCDVEFSVEQGSQIRSRTTATRVVTGAVVGAGVGAIVGAVAKKKSGGEIYLVVNGPDFQWVKELDGDPTMQHRAHAFAAVANTVARQHKCVAEVA